MNQQRFIFTILVITLACACSKNVENSNPEILGSWVWESSSSPANAQILPTDTSATFSLQFNSDFSFRSNSGCIIGGPAEGNYQTQNLNNARILILKSPNYQPDTLKFLLTGNSLVLTEKSNGYLWSHYFYKR